MNHLPRDRIDMWNNTTSYDAALGITPTQNVPSAGVLGTIALLYFPKVNEAIVVESGNDRLERRHGIQNEMVP
jgi:hypothetical protein